MEDTEILNLWKSYDQKLETSLLVNQKNVEDITKMKVRSLLASMAPLKIFTILIGMAWVGFMAVMLIKLWPVASPFFLISAGIQVLFTTLAIVAYLYQLVLIHQVDITEPILIAQQKTAGLKSSTLWVTRLLFLQLPVWTTFYLTESMFRNGQVIFFIVQGIVTFSMTYFAVWLFANIKYKNKDKKWFGLLFTGKEWAPVIKSIELLQEIETYNPDNKIK